MIRVRISIDGAGILRSCRVEGHALAGPKGADPVCTAVSVLLRSALRTLAKHGGLKIRAGAPGRGLMWLEADYSPEGRDLLAAVGDFLIEGLRSVSEEFPDYCGIEIENRRPGGEP